MILSTLASEMIDDEPGKTSGTLKHMNIGVKIKRRISNAMLMLGSLHGQNSLIRETVSHLQLK